MIDLIKLDLQINSFVVLLEAPTVDLNLAFFTMAWIAVYQIKELGSTTRGIFRHGEQGFVWQTVEFERPSQYRPV